MLNIICNLTIFYEYSILLILYFDYIYERLSINASGIFFKMYNLKKEIKFTIHILYFRKCLKHFYEISIRNYYIKYVKTPEKMVYFIDIFLNVN